MKLLFIRGNLLRRRFRNVLKLCGPGPSQKLIDRPGTPDATARTR
jgi:hypothetical protein